MRLAYAEIRGRGVRGRGGEMGREGGRRQEMGSGIVDWGVCFTTSTVHPSAACAIPTCTSV